MYKRMTTLLHLAPVQDCCAGLMAGIDKRIGDNDVLPAASHKHDDLGDILCRQGLAPSGPPYTLGSAHATSQHTTKP